MEVMGRKRKIGPGVYLVIDPSLNETVLLEKLRIIAEEQIVAVQLWDNFPPRQDSLKLIREVIKLCHAKDVPVLINNKWGLLHTAAFDGVHFDAVPDDLDRIKGELGREFIVGLTCNNDLSLLYWANDNGIDYVSFCSVFPSRTSNSCELVDFKTIREAKKIISMPVFLAGGITPSTMPELKGLPFDGVAVVSGIMGSDKPGEIVKEFSRQLKN
jgi:thiamine-phosphate pyrophosphorylase